MGEPPSQMRPPPHAPAQAAIDQSHSHDRSPPCRSTWYPIYCLRDEVNTSLNASPCTDEDFDAAAFGCAGWAKTTCTTCTLCFAAGCPFVDQAFASSPSPPPLPPALRHEALLQSCCSSQPDRYLADWIRKSNTPNDPENGKYGCARAARHVRPARTHCLYASCSQPTVPLRLVCALLPPK